MPAAERSGRELGSFGHMAWSAVRDGASFHELVSRYRAVRGTAPELTFWTLISEEERPSLSAMFPQASLLDGPQLRPLRGGAEILSLDLGGDRESMELLLIPSAHPGVVHLASDAPSTDRTWRLVERHVRRAAPSLSPVQLDQSDFVAIAEGLGVLGTVEVSRMTARFRSDGSSISRGWRRDPRLLRPTPSEAVAELEMRGVPRTMTISIDDALSIHLRREAGATFYSGSFEAFESLVLSRLADLASDRRSLLVGRHRNRAEAVRPVSVTFDAPLFESIDSLHLVLDALGDMPSVGLAVLHRNPYLHLMLTSYVDGSSFDVMVTRPDEIAVYPGFRASMSSFSSVLQQMVEHLGAAAIADTAPRHEPTLDELFAASGV